MLERHTAASAVSCFNSATTRRPWRRRLTDDHCGDDSSWLQFGHDPEAVETNAGHAFDATGKQLQFGHDPEAVETRRQRRAMTRPRRMLQFGHDPEAVETTVT